MKELLEQLGNPNEIEIKLQIESILKEAYIGVCELKKRVLAKTLTIEYVEAIEALFKSNGINVEEMTFGNRYLIRYAECLFKFWDTYTYYNWTQRSRGKFDLFKSLKDGLLMNIYFENECAKVIRRMEDYWMASNQVFTKYQISLIKQEYIR